MANFICQHAGLVAPGPVVVRLAGGVHAAVAAVAQHILQGNYRLVGHRKQGQANQRPVDALGADAAHILQQAFAIVVRHFFVPAQGGVVVVGTVYTRQLGM